MTRPIFSKLLSEFTQGWKTHMRLHIPSLTLHPLRCMFILEVTWSEACWVGIFAHCCYSQYILWQSATGSISRRQHLWARVCVCMRFTQTAKALADSESAYHTNYPKGGLEVHFGVVMEALRSQKSIYQAGAAMTKQIWRWLECTIWPREEWRVCCVEG